MPTNAAGVRYETALGSALMATRGYAGLQVEETYLRARELCRQIGDTPQLFPVLHGLYRYYHVRGELQAAREAGQPILCSHKAERIQRSSSKPSCSRRPFALDGRCDLCPATSGTGRQAI